MLKKCMNISEPKCFDMATNQLQFFYDMQNTLQNDNVMLEQEILLQQKLLDSNRSKMSAIQEKVNIIYNIFRVNGMHEPFGLPSNHV